MIIRIKRKTLELGILSLLGLFLIASILIGVSFTTNYVAGANNITNLTVIAKVNVTNTEPNITSVTVNDGIASPANEIDLTANGVTVVTCNATVFDFNGFDDIMRANRTNATFFLQSVGLGNLDDNNTYYTNNSCGRCRQASESANPSYTAYCDCRFAVQYYANNSNDWACRFGVRDAGGTQKSGFELNLTDEDNSTAVTVTKLLAIDAPAILNYGNLSVTETSGEIVHNVTNVGNIPLNLSLRGFGGTNGSTDVDNPGNNVTMICDFGNISIGSQRYTLGSEFAGTTSFNSMVNLQNQTKITNITFPQRVDDTKFGPDRNSTFWRINVPYSVGGLCNGTIIFGAVTTS